ncbi:alpha/beta hydrolase [Proteobacteria bacterium 005FR1]|nr:alpha/beta hydrolase [Proteobacteria bacterium 005FR1]
MASWQAHALSFMLRHTLKKQLKKSVGDIAAMRKAFGKSAYKVPDEIEITPATVGGVPGEWVTVAGGQPRATMLFLHGGGYFGCSPKTHRSASCAFAQRGFRVFVPDYRLAPEHPFPAPVEDARAVLAALREELGSTDKLVIAGDSAGGGLALATMVADRDAGLSLPSVALLFSPWTDLAVTGDSISENARRCAMFSPDGVRYGAGLYLNGADPKNPLASPLYADLKGLPPLLVHASESEALRDDSLRLAERAKAQGVDVTLETWPVVPHVWLLFHQMIPEGRESIDKANEFAWAHLQSATQPRTQEPSTA